jgi:disulfide bond formation protein DsbB
MTPLTSTITVILSILTVAAQVAVLVWILALVLLKNRRESKIIGFFAEHGLLFTFLIATGATLGSLFYSEIAGFEPCKLCWFQRLFMYPQMFMLGVALWKKDESVLRYSIVLSLVGAAIALYHYLLQLGIAPAVPCAAVGQSADCSQRFVMEMGYVTIPMMSLTVFALMLVCAISQRKFGRYAK